MPQHPVVEGGHGARVLTVDGGEDGVQFDVRSQTDAGDALVGVHQDDRHGDDAIGEGAVGVADGAAPFLDRRQGAKPGNPHVSPSWSRR
jgi:hypothetical protein